MLSIRIFPLLFKLWIFQSFPTYVQDLVAVGYPESVRNEDLVALLEQSLQCVTVTAHRSKHNSIELNKIPHDKNMIIQNVQILQ